MLVAVNSKVSPAINGTSPHTATSSSVHWHQSRSSSDLVVYSVVVLLCPPPAPLPRQIQSVASQIKPTTRYWDWRISAPDLCILLLLLLLLSSLHPLFSLLILDHNFPLLFNRSGFLFCFIFIFLFYFSAFFPFYFLTALPLNIPVFLQPSRVRAWSLDQRHLLSAVSLRLSPSLSLSLLPSSSFSLPRYIPSSLLLPFRDFSSILPRFGTIVHFSPCW